MGPNVDGARKGGRRTATWLAWVLGLCIATFSLAAIAAPGVARIHYHRNAADYAGWQLYTWYGALNPSPQWNPAQAPSGSDAFGVYYDVPLKTSDSGLNWILHDASGNNKNCPDDRYQPFPADVVAAGVEIWQLQDDCTVYLSAPPFKVGNVAQARGFFLDRQTLAWPGASAASTYRLYYAPAGGISTSQAGVAGGQWLPLTVQASGLNAALRARFPHLSGALALSLAADQLPKLPELLRGQLVLAAFGANGLIDATALQLPGVLDDLYAFDGRLGAVLHGHDRHDDDRHGRYDDDGHGRHGGHGHDRAGGGLQFRVWAPTARSVTLKLFDRADGPLVQSLPMRFDGRTGVWSAEGQSAWANRRYYQYQVAVYTRSLDKVVVNDVADPYSLAAAPGNERSLIVDLDAPGLKPAGWHRERPDASAPQDIVLYETHIRDFSATDLSVPAADRGKFRAFGYANTNGMQHLRALSRAGLTHIHLLPAFEIASVPASGCINPAIPAAAADSSLQQAALDPVRDKDCFNWGYDPVLYTVPGASYASSPVGTARVLEFRQMVQGIHDAGLRVVMDVVFNHTNSSGQNPNSILDKIVPGYYYRLSSTGSVLTDSCCQDTASEHAMMGKLLIDSVLTWARHYQVDGFRFDLMSFTPKAVMLELKARLARIDPSIYVYGEGWNFGSVGNDARFQQATQRHMAGTGIGTFNDRLRDAVRGGGPFDGGSSLIANQGFINGLWLDPNTLNAPATSAQRDALNRAADFVRLGLTGTLRDYVFTDKDGNTRTGAQMDYFGQPAGYAANPPDVINYISAHDNTTIFDNHQFKLPVGTSMADRVRVNSLGVAVLALSQGVAFFHAGDDLLRSKSFDANSYNSGDWFNRLDLSYQTSNWGVGLPPAFAGNSGNWPLMQPLLANPALKPAATDIAQAHAVFLDWIKLRRSSALLRLPSGAEVKRRVRFANVGPDQVPGLVVMAIDDSVGPRMDPHVRSLVAVINAAPTARSFALPGYANRRLVLHPVQATGADAVVKTSAYAQASGTVTVPARTAAVFIESR